MSTEYYNPGQKGQTRSTWRDKNHLRGVLLRLMTDNPTAEKEHLESLYLKLVLKSPELKEEAIRRCFANDLAMINQGKINTKIHNIRSKTQIVKEIGEKIRQTVLLDLVMPNDKKLRDCTGTECGKFSSAFAKLKDKVGRRVVGKVLTESEVRKIIF